MARSIGKNDCETVVIGAGPYGLAVAAHLKARGVSTHAFGDPLSFWRQNMPSGMKLRSPWGATTISDPAQAFSFDAYVKSQGIARVEPTPLPLFLGYGAWFQANTIPDLDSRRIARLDSSQDGFVATTEDGASIRAKNVVIAMGLANQQFRPAAFTNAPAARVTHSSEHSDFDRFRGKRVAVIGRGQSACETAVLLSEIGAEPELICRGPVHWLGQVRTDPSWRQVLKASLLPIVTAPSAVGPFPLNWLVEAPHLVHFLPAQVRTRFNAKNLRAAAAGWLLPRFGNVRVRSGVAILDAVTCADGITLTFDHGAETYDHVVLATGYRIDIARFGIMTPSLLSAIRCCAGSPVLSATLESSVPGLYFVGASAVFSLGPLMRFVAGTDFAARTVARAIGGQRKAARLKDRSCLEYDVAT